MICQKYLSDFSKEEVVKDIKESFTQSKDFVNLFLGYTIDKSDEDKNKIFNKVLDNMADILADTK